MWNKSIQKNRAFTLVEVLVAIFVFTVGVTGAFKVIQDTNFSFQINASKLAATYLAQERIEWVRNQRDSNWIAGSNWDENWPSGKEENLLGKFERTTTITPELSGEKTVLVEVSWEERGRTFSVSVQTKLYNWKE